MVKVIVKLPRQKAHTYSARTMEQAKGMKRFVGRAGKVFIVPDRLYWKLRRG